eukprot:scaffold7382_cov406-Prasinococcus_capsulatus_cf.AAC.6
MWVKRLPVKDIIIVNAITKAPHPRLGCPLSLYSMRKGDSGENRSRPAAASTSQMRPYTSPPATMHG